MKQIWSAGQLNGVDLIGRPWRTIFELFCGPPVPQAQIETHRSLDRGRDTTGRGTPRSDPDGRLLAHPVLISDDWRQSDLRDKDGVRAVEGAIGQPEREYVSRRTGVSGCGGEVFATTARLAAPGIRRDCQGSPVPHSS